MKKQKTFFYALIFLSAFTACKQNTSHYNENVYFDLKKYFIAEAGLHNSLHDKAQKTLIKENHSETKSFNSINWIEELTPFIETDINKPAWKNSFTIDSVANGNKVRISYLCKEKSVPVKKVIIEKMEQQVSKIIIETGKENVFYEATSTLEYIPFQGYTIKSRQKSFLSHPDEFELKVNFTK